MSWAGPGPGREKGSRAQRVGSDESLRPAGERNGKKHVRPARLLLYVGQRTVDKRSLPEPVEEHWRPLTRAECLGMERPCPYVGCRHHLFLEVLRTGNIRLNFPDPDPSGLTETCSLDVADGGEASLDDIAYVMNVTRERVRQMVESGLRKVEAAVLGGRIPPECLPPDCQGKVWSNEETI